MKKISALALAALLLLSLSAFAGETKSCDTKAADCCTEKQKAECKQEEKSCKKDAKCEHDAKSCSKHAKKS